MRGHVRKRCACDKAGVSKCRHAWWLVAYLGEQPCRKCPTCRKRLWTRDQARPLSECPTCGAELVDRIEPRQLWKGGFKTRTDAEQGLRRLLHQVDEGTFIAPTKQTFAEYLTETWLPTIQVRASTRVAYKTHVRKYLLPALGHVQLRGLTPAPLNALYRDLEAAGLSANTVRRVHATARKALNDAVRWNLITLNPAQRADPPTARRKDMKTWTPAQLRTFLDAVRDDRLTALWHFIGATGVRRGEAAGLQWVNLDLETGRASIQRELIAVEGELLIERPKSGRGRQIALDQFVVVALKAHKARQAQERLALGPAYGDGDFVFARQDGSPIHPSWISKTFTELALRFGIPHIRLHDLRHSYATMALAAGVHPKVVQERLGHSSIQVTLDTYSHVAPSLDEDAAERVADLIWRRPGDAPLASH